MKHLIFLSFSLSLALPAAAQVRVPIQGHLSDSGVALAGPVDLAVSVIDDVGGELSCETFTGVALADGVFNLIVGDTLNDCGGGLPTALSPEFFRGITELRVVFNAQTYTFPMGDAPAAGFAFVADSASFLGGFSADQLAPDPRVLRAPEGQLGNALLDAAALGGQVLIEVGPGAHNGDFTVPTNVSLSGAGPEATVINGTLNLAGNNRIANLAVSSGADIVIAINAQNNDRVELVDVKVTAFNNGVNGGVAVGVLTGGTGTRLFIERSELIAFATAASIAIFDSVGVRIELRDSELRLTNPSTLGFGVRVGLPGVTVPFHTLEVRDTKISVSQTTGFCAGIEANADDGSVRLSGVEIRAFCPGSQGFSLAFSGSADVFNSQIEADDPLNNQGFMSVFGSLLNQASGAGSMLAPGSAPVGCTASYTRGNILDSTCATP